jgi:hypothetical protein
MSDLIDEPTVRAFLTLLHQRAAGALSHMRRPGVLHLISIAADDPRGMTVSPFNIGDIDHMVAAALIDAKGGRNVFVEIRSVRPGLPHERKKIEATLGVFAMVIDRTGSDGDDNDTAIVETGPDNFQEWLFLDRALDAADAKALGIAVMRAYRVPGTPSYPDANERARDGVAVPTKLVRASNKLWTRDEVAAAFPTNKRTTTARPRKKVAAAPPGLATALKLAARGIRVFPCRQDKVPHTEHGFRDASCGNTTVAGWWERWPDALIGVPTGAVSGFDVLDLDAKHETARAWWRDNRDRLPRARTHRTRSGGLHVLFKHDDLVSCSTGRIALGVDTRGTGGYAIWWPAAGLPVLSNAPLAAWPEWLLAEFRPKPQPPKAPESTIAPNGDGWLRGLVRVVAAADEGYRNSILFWASCRAGEAVRYGKADESFITEVLLEAARHAGLPEQEAARTIQSGVRRT